MGLAEDLADEARRARKVRQIVDITTAFIMQSGLGRSEAEALVTHARLAILDLFPGCEETFEIIYAPRFRRLVEEFARPAPADRRGVVIPFPPPQS